MERPSTKATVVLLIDKEGRVCLARKKQAIHHQNGEIGYSLGLYNGYGGKCEEMDSDIYATALRELYDESGVIGKREDLEPVSRVYFYIHKEGENIPFMDVTFFVLRVWQGEPCEGGEMGSPRFFAPHEIPYNEMMPADKVLFENILRGEKGGYQVKLFGKDMPPEIENLDDPLEV